MLSNLGSFLKSKVFFTNLILAFVAAIVAMFCIYGWLSSYTHHGESISVPDVRGLKIGRLETFLQDKNLNYKIVDSLYEIGKAPEIILEQDPAPDSKVKEGRTIYLTINASKPPKVKMPNLVDVSYRQAVAILQTFGLKTGQLIYHPDLAKNAVLDQYYKGSHIDAGKEIYQGSVIDLVLGDGVGNVEIAVPDLTGLTRGEALFVLKGSSLNIGTVHFDSGNRDSSSAKVYRQEPSPQDQKNINQGGAIDLYLR